MSRPLVTKTQVFFSWVAWVVGLTVACALLWHLMGMFLVEGNLSNMNWLQPISWVAPGAMGLLFGSMMWSASTPHAQPSPKRDLPKVLVGLYRFRFLVGWAVLTSAVIALSGFSPAAFIGGPIVSAIIIAFAWSFTSMRSDNQKTEVRSITRLDLANRMDKANDAYIKSLPPLSQRARDKELPFLQVIHNLNSMVIKQKGYWPPTYAEYAAGSFRACRLMLEHLKPNLYREDIVVALFDASDFLTERADKFDIDGAEKAVIIVEVLLAVGVDANAS